MTDLHAASRQIALPLLFTATSFYAWLPRRSETRAGVDSLLFSTAGKWHGKRVDHHTSSNAHVRDGRLPACCAHLTRVTECVCVRARKRVVAGAGTHELIIIISARDFH